MNRTMNFAYKNVVSIFVKLKEAIDLDDHVSVTCATSQIVDMSEELCKNIYNSGKDTAKAVTDILVYCIHRLLESYDNATLQTLSESAAENDDLLQIDHKTAHQKLAFVGEIIDKLLSFGKLMDKQSFCINIRPHGYLIISVYLKISSHHNEWSCILCSKASQNVLKIYLSLHGYASLKDAVNNTNTSMFSRTLDKLLSPLSRKVWKRYPANCNAVIQLLSNSSSENLSKSLNKFFPLILWMLDDFCMRNILLGLDGLKIMLSNLPSAEIRSYGRGDVIFDVLLKKVNSRNVCLVDRALSCLLQCIKMLERDPRKTDMPRKLTKYDKAFEALLFSLNACTDKQLARIYLRKSKDYISAMNITTARHLKSLVPVIEYQLDVGDDQTIVDVCSVIESLVMVCWNRHSTFLSTVLTLFVKRLLRLSEPLNADQVSLVEAVSDCMSSLAACDNELVKGTAAEIIKMPQVQHYGPLRTTVDKILLS